MKAIFATSLFAHATAQALQECFQPTVKAYGKASDID